VKHLVTPLIITLAVSACASKPREDTNTLKSLEARTLTIERDQAIAGSREKAIQAYRQYLNVAPKDKLRPEAMRRLGDMEIGSADERSATRERINKDDYRRAVRVYQNLLRTYPRYPNNDRVLYQLSRAQEQVGELNLSLASLDRLVSEYPQSAHYDEAQFRRGELLFTLREYPKAEQAYSQVLARGPDKPYYERSLYMRGWSRFKQSQYDEGLKDFFVILDRKLIGKDNGEPLETMTTLTRGERELVEDTFRVTSISLSALDGPRTIPGFFRDARRRDYEFRVYQQLGDLYFKQQRIKDAADTYNAFARLYPTHPQAPLVQVRVIDAYQEAGFPALAIETKKEFVLRYGVKSDFRKANDPMTWERVEPQVRKHMEQLARHYHAAAQKSRKPPDYQESERWYRLFLESFPTDRQAPDMNFMLADLLTEQKRHDLAAVEYESAAYRYPRHAKSVEAGYAALQAYAQQGKLVTGKEQEKVRWRAINSSLRFAERFPSDPRVAGVLTNTAEQYYNMHEPLLAAATAQRVLAIKPEISRDLRRTAWTVTAHSEFDRGNFARAEAAYQQVLALTDEKAPHRSALTERLAASVYKQGEQARSAGKDRDAANHFLRVATLTPTAAIRVTAEYDAAASLIAAKDWSAAAPLLEAFRRNHPKHPLQAEIPAKLAVVYLESGQAGKAAAEFEAIASRGKDVRVSREALWQAAELYEKAGQERNALITYERYVRQHPNPFETAIEARARLLALNHKAGQEAKRLAWARELVEVEQKGGRDRTARTRYLGAQNSLLLAEPIDASYRAVKLVEPLKKNLKLKKEKLQKALDAYGMAADYGVAEVATAAVYRTADLYHDFSKALMQSQRPKGLNAEEKEQYNVLLEEQAYPFEEKAIEIHEINVRRTKNDIYDQWVKGSFAALTKLRPVRYGKSEKSEGVIRVIR